ncbi:MAG: hypothetical protein PHO45_07560, partial [Victivallaceae bacterium]|nr:hypothetical protein [Victivallaceae bacterium]
MRVKINGVLTERELEIIIGCGADEVGIFIGQQYASPFFILPSTAARLVKMLPPGICPVMDTHITDHHELLSLMERSGIYTVNCIAGSRTKYLNCANDCRIMQKSYSIFS